MVHNNVFGVILAGGSGSRLWPLSREMFPKQLLNLYSDLNETLFQQTVKLLNRIVEDNNILIVTNIKHESDLKIQFEELFKKSKQKAELNLLIEPIGRNTAPAILSSVLYIKNNYIQQDQDAIIIISPADHFITDKEKFTTILNRAIELATENNIVTLGINPSKPETAYGYIKVDNKNNAQEDFYKVQQFLEKPALEKAEEFLKEDCYYWNSGLFVFKASVILEEIHKYCPELLSQAQNIDYRCPSLPFEEYKELPEISIDYAVMEKTEKIVVLPCDAGWSDLGSWNSVYENSHKDEDNNFIFGNVLALGCKNSLIYGRENLVATIGMENTVIVSTEDATLVCDLNNTQDVKKIYNELKKVKSSAYKAHKTQLRPWGYHSLLKEEEKFKIRSLCIKPKCKSSFHMHYHRNKHWTVVDGVAAITKNDQQFYLHPGESIDIKATEKHMVFNPGKIDLKIIEVQTGNYLGDDDIVHF